AGHGQDHAVGVAEVGHAGDLARDMRLQVRGVGEAHRGGDVPALERLAQVHPVQARAALDAVRRGDEEESIVGRDGLDTAAVLDQQRPVLDVTVVVYLAHAEAAVGADADERAQVGGQGVHDLPAGELGGKDAAGGQRGYRAGGVQAELQDLALAAGVPGRVDGVGALGKAGEGEGRVEVRELRRGQGGRSPAHQLVHLV